MHAAACATAELDNVLVDALGAAVKDGPGGVSVDCEAVDKTETDGLGTGTVGEVVEGKAGQADIRMRLCLLRQVRKLFGKLVMQCISTRYRVLIQLRKSVN